MKGWVYVISNKAMPGMVKVGYSMQDPTIRAEELDQTGSPHPYVVEYGILTEEPNQVEQEVHKTLSDCHEGKEWFHCTAEDALAAIRMVAGERAITETFNVKAWEKLVPENYQPKDISVVVNDILSDVLSLEFYLSHKEEKINYEVIGGKVKTLKALTIRAAEMCGILPVSKKS